MVVAAAGVDLGTAEVRVALVVDGKVLLVEDADGSPNIPAVVSFPPGEERVGRTAARDAWRHPLITLRAVRRWIGRPSAGSSLPGAPDPRRAVSALLEHLQRCTRERFGVGPGAAVLAVPIWYAEHEQHVLGESARAAGLRPLYLPSDPVAAAVSVALTARQERDLAVVDVGAGGISAAVLRVGPRSVRLLGASGDASGGGEDADRACFLEAIRRLTREDPGRRLDASAEELLRAACEQARIDLSSTASVTRDLPFLATGSGAAPPTLTLGEEDLEELLAPCCTTTERCCRRAVREAGLKPGALHGVLLRGRMARTPAIQRAVERALGRSGADAGRFQLDGAVALGAAQIASSLLGLTEPIEVDETRIGRLPPERAAPEPRQTPLPPRPSRPGVPLGTTPAAASTPEPRQTSPPPRPSRPGEVPPRTPAPAGAPEPRQTPLPPRPSRPGEVPLRTTLAAASAPEPRQTPLPPRPSRPGEVPPRTPAAASAPEPRQPPLPPQASSAAREDRHVPSGQIANPTDAAGLLRLPLWSELSGTDLRPVALPVLLLKVVARQKPSGTLLVSRGEANAVLPVTGGTGLLTDREHDELLRCFEWPEGRYRFDSGEPSSSGRKRYGMVQLVVGGVRRILRTLPDAEILGVLEPHLDLCPTVRADKERRLGALSQHDSNIVRRVCDGSTRGSDILAKSGGIHHTLLRLLLLGEMLDLLAWSPSVQSPTTPASLLHAQLEHALGADHFEALGLHWSAGGDEVESAYRKRCQPLEEGSPLRREAPDLCRRLLERYEQAYRVLIDPDRRRGYREQVHPEINVEATKDLLEKRAEALAMRTADPASKQDELSTRETLRELGRRGPWRRDG